MCEHLSRCGVAAFLLGIDPLGEDVTRSFLNLIIDAALTGGALLLVLLAGVMFPELRRTDRLDDLAPTRKETKASVPAIDP